MDFAEVIVTAIADVLEVVVNVVVTAVPDMGGLPLAMVGAGAALLLMAWHFDYI